MGKSIAQGHTVNEPVSGIHIKFCAILMHTSVLSTHAGFKCLFNTVISSGSKGKNTNQVKCS